MNKAQRAKINALLEQVVAITSQLEDIKREVETEAEAEREKFDNMTEGLQQGERGQAIDEAANSLEDAVSNLETIESEFEELHSNLEAAISGDN